MWDARWVWRRITSRFVPREVLNFVPLSRHNCGVKTRLRLYKSLSTNKGLANLWRCFVFFTEQICILEVREELRGVLLARAPWGADNHHLGLGAIRGPVASRPKQWQAAHPRCRALSASHEAHEASSTTNHAACARAGPSSLKRRTSALHAAGVADGESEGTSWNRNAAFARGPDSP
jgi:hypothetical protein